MPLGEKLDGAKMVMYDPASGYTLCWFGGTFIHAYDESGREVAYWGVDSHEREADPDQIKKSMARRIANQDYHNFR